MKPYYETKLGKLYHGDCLEIMPMLEGVYSCDLILSDPQYGINHPTNYKSRGRSKLAECNDYAPVYGDNQPFNPSFLLSLNRPMILWGANHYANKLPNSSGWLIWDKKRPDNLDQATCEIAWTNFVKGIRRFGHLWHGMMRESERGENYHPTQKPIALMMWCLTLKWTPAGVVVDPFVGSGPIPIACERLNRRWIGIEIEEKYCEIAAKRIEKENQQLKLF